MLHLRLFTCESWSPPQCWFRSTVLVPVRFCIVARTSPGFDGLRVFLPLPVFGWFRRVVGKRWPGGHMRLNNVGLQTRCVLCFCAFSVDIKTSFRHIHDLCFSYEASHQNLHPSAPPVKPQNPWRLKQFGQL